MDDVAILITKRLAEAYNRKDWNAFADLLDPNAIYASPNMEGSGVERHEGIEAILEYMKEWPKVIPDDKATFIDSQLLDDETVVCKVVWSGTRSGAPFVLRGITVRANGRNFTNRGSRTYKVQNGKIVQITDEFHVSEFLAGFGIRSN